MLRKWLTISTLGMAGIALPTFSMTSLVTSNSSQVQPRTQQPTGITLTEMQADGQLAGLTTVGPTETMLLEWIFGKREQIFSNLPSDVIIENFSLTNYSRKSNEGKISFNVNLYNYYNSIGEANQTDTPLTIKNFTITGFVSSNTETTVKTNVKATGDIASFVPYQLSPNSESIRTFVIDNILENPPIGMQTKDILDVQYSSINNLTGTIVISKIEVYKRSDSNGTTLTGRHTYTQHVTITGLRKITPTRFRTELDYDKLNLQPQNNLYDASQNVENYIKTNLVSLLVDGSEAPETIKVVSFEQPNVMHNNKLEIAFYVSEYFSENGNYVKYVNGGDNASFKMIINNFPYTDNSIDTKAFFSENNHFWTIFLAIGCTIIVGLLVACIVVALKGKKKVVYQGANAVPTGRRLIETSVPRQTVPTRTHQESRPPQSTSPTRPRK